MNLNVFWKTDSAGMLGTAGYILAAFTQSGLSVLGFAYFQHGKIKATNATRSALMRNNQNYYRFKSDFLRLLMEVTPEFQGRETDEESCSTLWSLGREIMSDHCRCTPRKRAVV